MSASPRPSPRTVTALLVVREHVIAPILAGVRSPLLGRKPARSTTTDRDDEALPIDTHTLVRGFAVTTRAAKTTTRRSKEASAMSEPTNSAPLDPASDDAFRIGSSLPQPLGAKNLSEHERAARLLGAHRQASQLFRR